VHQSYVVGFLFTDHGDQVVLIEKLRPEWQKGLLNGPGGEVKERESPDMAMTREFKEEAGPEIEGEGWDLFLTLIGHSPVDSCAAAARTNWTVYFYRCFDTELFNQCETKTNEVVVKLDVNLALAHYTQAVPEDRVRIKGFVTPVPWAIKMALSMDNDRASLFVVTERY